MKIDVITLQAVQNYGSVLQALATQEAFKQHGCEVAIINYTKDSSKYENLIKSWGKGNPIKGLVMLPTIKRWKHVFKGFCQQHLNLTKEEYFSESDFEKYPLKSDAYCTGSDQVWNSKWNNGVIPPLYLSFVPNECYKFAYSASFGQLGLTEEEVSKTKKYIEEYKHISVREKSALDILKCQYGYESCLQIVDPTLVMPPDFWRKIASRRRIKSDYILIYNLNRSSEFDNYAVGLAKKSGLKLVRLCTRYDQFYRPGKSILIPEIPEFISLIDNARYVLTDSFHATAFAMNMNTEPICVYPKEFFGRLESFLELTKSKHRHAKDFSDFEIVNGRPVDFTVVNEILDAERKRAHGYIDTVIKEIGGRKCKL